MHYISFAFLTMFHALQMCVSMLEPCVVAGLDWAEPMMYFFVARHMIMHYSCVHIFSFPPWYILLIDAFLFLSLSLSLSDSLRMAPKHKTTPSQNLLHSGASSSDSTLLHVRFRDKKVRQDFSENFSKHGIHSDCHVILSDYSDTTFLTVIRRQGWESLCEIPVNYPFMIIQEFYSNMHGFDYSIPHFITSIRGTHIVVTPKLISDVLHVLRESHPDYPGCPCLRTMSKDELLSFFL